LQQHNEYGGQCGEQPGGKDEAAEYGDAQQGHRAGLKRVRKKIMQALPEGYDVTLCWLKLQLLGTVQTSWPCVTFLHIDALITERKLAVGTMPTAVRRGMVSTITHDVVLCAKGST
jgi:hypothetical protein